MTMADKFADKTEYMASLRDRSRIEAITSQVNVNDPKIAGELYRRLKARPSYFETETGRKFIKSLFVTSEGAKRMSEPAPFIPDEDDEAFRVFEDRTSAGRRDLSGSKESAGRRDASVSGESTGKRDITWSTEPAAKQDSAVKATATSGKRPANSKITIVDGPETLKERYNAPSESAVKERERMRAIDEITSSKHEYNEFWDDPDEAPQPDPVDIEKRRKRTRRLLLLVGAAAAVALGIFIGNEAAYRIQNSRSMKKMAELQSIVSRGSSTGNTEKTPENKPSTEVIDAHAAEHSGSGDKPEVTAEPTEAPEPTILPEYAELYARNNDMVGWISIPGTTVNYPVMQTPEDMEYYLLRDFDRKDDKNGLPFADSRSDVFAPTTNVLIYGHCMNSGAMFATLLNYKDQAYYKEHSVICFDTIYERREYEIIACFQSRVAYTGENVFRYYSFIDTDSETEFNDFVTNIKAMSYYNIPTTAQFGDELITLSTCDREITNGRMVVVARRKK